MAEEDKSQEKTEEPSAKRLRESREKGQVARSKDLNATVILLSCAIVFLVFGKEFSYQLALLIKQAFEFDERIIQQPMTMIEPMANLAKSGLWALVPIMALIMLMSILAPLLMGGWVFSAKLLAPQMSRLNLFKGLKRMVSVKGLVEMVKSFLKVLLVSSVAFVVLKIQIPALLSLSFVSLETAINSGALIIVKSFLFIAGGLIFIAMLDVPFQLYEHNKGLKMSKQELLDEYKESEGKPEVKGAIKRAQQEISRRRMMSELPKANVILTNPTHYAVALRYDQNGKKAPVLVAKGKDLIAFQIMKGGKEHNIPILSIPPLARSVYFSTKINAEIPRGLYVAVAQVLAYVYQLNRSKRAYKHDDVYKPSVLQNLPIPPELVRDAEEIIE